MTRFAAGWRKSVKDTDRFNRLLLLVPFVLKRSGVTVTEVCKRFEITRGELMADLDLLFMCGLPGYGPGDLIEAYVDDERVLIRMADYFSRPLRLTPAEGLLLYSGAEALAAAGGNSEALERAKERLLQVLGHEALDRVKVNVAALDELVVLREAMEAHKRIHIQYQSQSKDEVTERDVDPWALFLSAGRWYLVGWCHKVSDERIFRVDRIRTAAVLDVLADIPPDVDLSKYEALYVEGAGDFKITLEIAPQAAWVGDQYILTSREEMKDGWQRIQLSAGGTAWLERLLIRLGPHARLIEPEFLRENVKQTACRMAKIYDS